MDQCIAHDKGRLGGQQYQQQQQQQHHSPLKSSALPAISRDAMEHARRSHLVMEVFKMFDSDGSGEIELDEVSRAFRSMGKLTDETRQQISAHFAFMDTDGSGEVTLDEFRAAVGDGKIDFRDYQHQQDFQALGLTLCQNLAMYRRHVLHQEFEAMRKSGTGNVKDQFELLKKALAVCTFGLDVGSQGGGGGSSPERDDSNNNNNNNNNNNSKDDVNMKKYNTCREAGGKATRDDGRYGHRRGSGGGQLRRLTRKEARALQQVINAGTRRARLGPLPTKRRLNCVADAIAMDASTRGKKNRLRTLSRELPAAKVRRSLPPMRDTNCSIRSVRSRRHKYLI